MALSAGYRLGPYEILAPLGAGGMGEVYEAKDTRLDRTVAVKVLPSRLSDDARLKERFEREARAVSSLNHPHICTLHDIGSENGVDFMVMEHIEGGTLADRLRKGALPLDQALKHAVEIADALDKAHRQGVVHRDLKPGNIMLTRSGTKLLDFGLAKLRTSEPERDPSAPSALATEAAPLTKEGSLVGTFQYMSPEQLEGKEADSRADIFSFGAVLYEMVTGQRAFQGKSQASLVAAILEHDPTPISECRPVSPPALDHVVSTCLSKDPDQRWQSAADLTRQLEWTAGRGASTAAAPDAADSGRTTRRLTAGLALGLVIGVLVASVVVWSMGSAPQPQPVTLFSEALPPDDELSFLGRHVVALSPDGTRLVYVASGSLYLRAMDEREAKPIRGTEDSARSPFFSPDGKWVGFYATGYLKKVSVSGGPPATLCEAANPYGATWGDDDTIVFGQGSGGIVKVSAGGGAPEVLIAMDSTKGEVAHGPQILPGGETVLFTVSFGDTTQRGWDDAQIVLHSLPTGERQVLVNGGTDARYVPTGHLVYAREETLLAVPFDVGRLEVTGDPVPVIHDVMHATGSATGAAQFTFSRQGSLAYVPAGTEPSRTLVWVDREGQTAPVTEGRARYSGVGLSPDGKLAAVDDHSGLNHDIWICDLERGTRTRLTVGGHNQNPVWTPDGERVTFASMPTSATVPNLYWKPADGSGETQRLLEGGHAERYAGSWSPDGSSLAFAQNSGAGWDVWVLPPEGEPSPVLDTRFNEHSPSFSPDGRWLAYVSDESGRPEVYVRSFPDTGAKALVSPDGGTEPAWSQDRRELFYRHGNQMMSVEIETQPTFSAGTARVLFEGRYLAGSGDVVRGYDVSPDGQRFVMIQPGTGSNNEIHFVLNWFEELKRLVPTD